MTRRDARELLYEENMRKEVWIVIRALGTDPFPEVCSNANRIRRYMRNLETRHLRSGSDPDTKSYRIHATQFSQPNATGFTNLAIGSTVSSSGRLGVRHKGSATHTKNVLSQPHLPTSAQLFDNGPYSRPPVPRSQAPRAPSGEFSFFFFLFFLLSYYMFLFCLLSYYFFKYLCVFVF